MPVKVILLRALAVMGGLILTATFVLLGNWQIGRAQGKEALQLRLESLHNEPAIDIGSAPLDPASIDFRSATLRGVWVADKTVLVDNKLHHGRVGFYVVTPLKLEIGDMHVLVYRGWIEAPASRSEPPRIATPADMVELHGVLRQPPSRFMELSSTTREGNIWENLTVDRFREWSGLHVQPAVVYQTDGADDGLRRDWPAPDLNAFKHYFIACQWYAFALVIPALFIYFWLKGRKF